MHRGLLAVAVALALGAGPGSASALTLGSLDPASTDPGPSGRCVASQGNSIQGSIAAGSPSYTVPQGGGTITSWSTRWGIPGSGVALEVWRSDPTTSGQYVLVAKDSESLSLDASGVSTYHVSIPVNAGDYIGIAWPTANTITCEYHSPNDADTIWGSNGATYNPGDSANFGSFIVTRALLNLQANLQQAADLSLSQTASRSSVVAGNAVNFVLSASNSGPSPVTATVTDALPAGMTFFSAAAGGGSCSGGQTVTCQVPLAVGGSQTISIVAIAKSRGKLTNTATISSAATDATPADNSSSVAIQVVSVPKLAHISKKRSGRRETFKVTLDQPARVTVVIQRGGYRVASISRRGRAGLNRIRTRRLARGHYKAIFTASDAAGTSAARTVSFTIP